MSTRKVKEIPKSRKKMNNSPIHLGTPSLSSDAEDWMKYGATLGVLDDFKKDEMHDRAKGENEASNHSESGEEINCGQRESKGERSVEFSEHGEDNYREVDRESMPPCGQSNVVRLVPLDEVVCPRERVDVDDVIEPGPPLFADEEEKLHNYLVDVGT
ncbi:unnamed protein product [Arabis nemorensis]|uniref:Uncharacterized protein n=1 Tax=Arabis nemorensis TaxID=586526 RepID=A0A565B9K3_9BRAS|nr:unnamed protein product [Arabis nemorensis]